MHPVEETLGEKNDRKGFQLEQSHQELRLPLLWWIKSRLSSSLILKVLFFSGALARRRHRD